MDSSKKVKKYLALLEITPHDTQEKLKDAYKLQLRVWHPDRWNKDEKQKEIATHRTADINVGYKFLKENWTYINQEYSQDYEVETEPEPEQNSNLNSETKDRPSRKKREKNPFDDIGSIIIYTSLFIFLFMLILYLI